MFLLGGQTGGFMVLWGGVGLWQWDCISYCCAEYAQPLLTQRKWTKADHCHSLWMPWGMEITGCTKELALHMLPKQHFPLTLLEYWTKWNFLLTKISISYELRQIKMLHSVIIWFSLLKHFMPVK